MMRMALSFVALFLVFQLALSASGKYRKGGGKIDVEDDDDDDKDAVWLVHFGIGVDSREEYLDELTGEVKGFNVDILNAVCDIAERNCEIVYDQSRNCFDSVDGQAVGGQGLFNFYYDACVAWYPTLQRQRTFGFSYSFSKCRASGFVVLAGNPEGFAADDITASDCPIGFIRGFFADPGCVRREVLEDGEELNYDRVVIYDSVTDLKEALVNGEICAAFDWGTNYQDQDEFEFLNEDSPVKCASGGPGMMTRKDNSLNEWFNEALHELIGSEEYQAICDDIETVHGEKPGPSSADVCITE